MKDIDKSNCRQFNKVINKGTHYELILTNNKMEETGRAKIDKEDLGKLKAIGRWRLTIEGYVVNKKCTMHRVIMGAEIGEIVDHKRTGFKNRSDNRKKNLRICTHSDNSRNQGLNITNTSGYKGVSWAKREGKWIAQIGVRKGIKRTKKFLGYFDDVRLAAKAYEKAARALHGEFFNSGK